MFYMDVCVHEYFMVRDKVVTLVAFGSVTGRPSVFLWPTLLAS